MNKRASFVTFWCALSLSNFCLANIPIAPGGYSLNIEILETAFGLINTDNEHSPVLTPTTEIPLVPHQSYGWVIRIRTLNPTVKWREEFTLPEKPNTWGEPDDSASYSLSTDGLTSITEAEVSTKQGEISHAWQVAPGDPQGRYVIRVFIDGVIAKIFEFNVR